MNDLIFVLQIAGEILAFCTSVISLAAALHERRKNKSKKRRRKRR